MTTSELLDTLDEAARYVRTAPGEAVRLASDAAAAIADRGMVFGPGYYRDLSRRLERNILEGIRWCRVEPDVFRGYLLGAKFEIAATPELLAIDH